MSHLLPGGTILIGLVLGILSIGVTLSALRLAKGPTLADRVVAFDLVAIHVIGIIVTVAILHDLWLILDAVLILALLSFLATVAFARYIMRTNAPSRRWPR